MSQQITIETYDKELASELRHLNIDDTQINQRISTYDCADPSLVSNASQILTFVVTIGGTVAINMFSSWLYEKIKSKNKDLNIKINGVKINGDGNNLHIVIHNHFHSNKNTTNDYHEENNNCS